MPRVQINKKQYMLKDFTHWVLDRMQELHMNQTAAGALIGVSQQVFGKRLKNHSFTLEEVIELLHAFKATEDEVVKLLHWS